MEIKGERRKRKRGKKEERKKRRGRNADFFRECCDNLKMSPKPN